MGSGSKFFLLSEESWCVVKQTKSHKSCPPYKNVMKIGTKMYVVQKCMFCENVCCAYSSDVPRQGAGTSNEYPQHNFCGEIKKISILFG